MITAQQAKALYDESGAEVQAFLRYHVEKQIKDAASGGKRSVTIHLGGLEYFHHLDQEITPLQKAVVDQLKVLGYTAKIETYGDSYVPRGLADDDGNGPQHRNYGIIIGW